MCDLKGYTHRRRNELLDEALLNERERMIQFKIQRRMEHKRKKKLRDDCHLLIVCFTLGLCILGTLMEHAHAATESPVTDVEVFTTSQFPVGPTDMPGVNVKVYNLDQLQQSIAKVNQELQNMSQLQAEDGAKTWLAGQIPLLRDEFKGITLAQQYGIQQLPTVVFDHGKAESIGVTDLGIAVLDYQAWSNLK